MSSYEYGSKSVRSHSIHVAIARDYQRILRARKQEAKFQQDFLKYERKVASNAKWKERVDQRNAAKIAAARIASGQDQPPMTFEEFMVRERIKQDNIINAKKVANENIRRR